MTEELTEADITNLEALVRHLGAHGGRPPEAHQPLAWWLAEVLEEEAYAPVRRVLRDVPFSQRRRLVPPGRAEVWEKFCSRLDYLDALHHRGRTLSGDEGALGSWAYGTLTRGLTGQVSELERLLLDRRPAWDWNLPLPAPKTKHARWSACLNAVKHFKATHGHTDLPDGIDIAGQDLKAWWRVQRNTYANDGMKKGERHRLEALGTDLRTDKERAKADPAYANRDVLAELAAYIAAHGVASLPHQGNRIANKARAWLRDYHRGTLDPALVTALEAVEGWSWEPETALGGFAAFASAHGHLDIPADYTHGGEPLGSVHAEQEARAWDNQKGLNGPARRTQRQLTELRSTAWQTAMAALHDWYQHHTAPPEPDRLTPDGLRLGVFEEWARGQVTHAALNWRQITDLTRTTASSWWGETDADAFHRAMDALASFAHTHQHTHPRWADPVWKGVDLVGFLRRLDADHEDGELGGTEEMTLEALPGWSWSRYERAQGRQAAVLRARQRRPHETRRPVRTDLADPDSELARRGARHLLPDA